MPVDLEKLITEQSSVLRDIMESIGELKGMVQGIQQRQDIANHRTEKNENQIEAMNKFYNDRFEANNQRFLGLESTNHERKGEIRAIKWLWTFLMAFIGVAEFILIHYWK